MGWGTRTLGEICDEVGGIIRTGPFGSQLHQSDYQNEGLPVVMPKDIVDGRVSVDGIARIGDEDVERLSQHRLKKGDIVYGRRGDIGRRALITQREAGWLCGTGCLRISLGDSVLEPTFLYYYLGEAKVIGWIYNQAIGATMPNLNTSIIRSIPITYPSLPVQHKIAAILSAYDDLIENNTRRIEILEEMARSLHREWFVNFRFPGHEQVKMVDSELGLIPEGWEVKPIGDVAEVGRGSSPRPIADQKYFEGGTIPWIKIADATKSGKYLYETKQKVNEYGASFSRLLPKGSLIIAASGTLGYTQLLGDDGCIHDGWLYLINFNGIEKEYLYYLFLEQQQFFYNAAYGAAIQNVNTMILREMKIILPPFQIQKTFKDIISNSDNLLDNLGRKNLNIRRTRNLLLPKLISGAIDVEYLDIALKKNAA